MTDAAPGISAMPVLNPKPMKVYDLTHKAQAVRDKKVRNTIKMAKVVKYLKTRVNKTSYVFSGSSPYGWDCSGMVRWAYARFGLDVPHSANKQAHVGTRVSRPVLGDIVVFAYPGSTNFYHSAMYIGDGKIVHANQARKTTVIEPLSAYKNSQIRFVRLVTQTH
jgi:cell wall-associated NlpC family hydrolase